MTGADVDRQEREVIALLRQVDDGGLPIAVAPEDVLIRARCQHLRRRTGWGAALTGVGVAVAASAIVLLPGRYAGQDLTVVPGGAPSTAGALKGTSSAPNPAKATATTSVPKDPGWSRSPKPAWNYQDYLQAVYDAMGPDYRTPAGSDSGFAKAIMVTPGSPSAVGLPAGWQAGASAMDVTSADLSAGCPGTVEKAVTTTPCALVTATGGLSVTRQQSVAPNIPQLGTWVQLRISAAKPGSDKVIYADLYAWTTATTTATERAAATAWLDTQSPRLERLAVSQTLWDLPTSAPGKAATQSAPSSTPSKP